MTRSYYYDGAIDEDGSQYGSVVVAAPNSDEMTVFTVALVGMLFVRPHAC